MIAQLSLYILNTISFLENKCFSTTLHTHTHTHTMGDVPTLYHDLVHCTRATRRWWKSISLLNQL